MSCKELNILVIGACGAGKTSFIKLFDCWSKSWSVEDILNAKESLLKAKHPNEEDQEVERDFKNQGESQTKMAKFYKFRLEVAEENTNYLLNFIDTPGIGDTRGMQYDEQTIDLIVETVAKTEGLNAIILVLNGSESRTHARIQYMLKKLYSIIPKNFTQNLMILLSNVDLEPNLDIKAAFDSQLQDVPEFWYNNQIFNLHPKYLSNKNILARSQQTYQDSIETIQRMLRGISSRSLMTTQGFADIQAKRDRFKQDVINLGEIVNIRLMQSFELRKIDSDMKKEEVQASDLENKSIAKNDQNCKTVSTEERDRLFVFQEILNENDALRVRTQDLQIVQNYAAFHQIKKEAHKNLKYSSPSHNQSQEKYEKGKEEAIQTCSKIESGETSLKKNEDARTKSLELQTSEPVEFVQEMCFTEKEIIFLTYALRRVSSNFDPIKQISRWIKIFENKILEIQKNPIDSRSEIKYVVVKKILEYFQNIPLEPANPELFQENSEPLVQGSKFQQAVFEITEENLKRSTLNQHEVFGNVSLGALQNQNLLTEDSRSNLTTRIFSAHKNEQSVANNMSASEPFSGQISLKKGPQVVIQTAKKEDQKKGKRESWMWSVLRCMKKSNRNYNCFN